MYRADKGFVTRKKTDSKKRWSQEELLMGEILDFFVVANSEEAVAATRAVLTVVNCADQSDMAAT